MVATFLRDANGFPLGLFRIVGAQHPAITSTPTLAQVSDAAQAVYIWTDVSCYLKQGADSNIIATSNDAFIPFETFIILEATNGGKFFSTLRHTASGVLHITELG